MTAPSDQLVYGNIKLTLVSPGVVSAGYDQYNFDIKKVPLNVDFAKVVGRNIATAFGSAVNSATSFAINPIQKGSSFFIQLDGTAKIK